MLSQQVASGDVNWPLIAGLVPAVVSGVVAYTVARLKFTEELQKIRLQVSLQREGLIATLRQRYISPLRFFASTLSRRLGEMEDKLKNASYGQVQGWLQEIKDHADGSRRRSDFPVWCCYEGIFAMTTLYYTCSYFQCAREIRSRAPFSELDVAYGRRLEECLVKISEAFAWGEDGFWLPIQDVIGERFTKGEIRTEYEELCRFMDSKDDFRYAPFFRPIDVYIHHFDRDRAERIRAALDELVTFIDSRPTPENRRSVV